MDAGRGMVGTARGVEALLHVALKTSQFRPWVRDYGMPASQNGRLHHHPSHCLADARHTLRQRCFAPCVTRGIVGHGAAR